MNARELRDKRMNCWEQMKVVHDRADAENRDLSADEQSQWDSLREEYKALGQQLGRQEFLESTPARDEEQRVWQVEQDRAGGPPTSEADALARNGRTYENAFRAYLSIDSPRMLEAEDWRALHQRARALSD